MCFVWISEKTTIFSLYRNNLPVFIIDEECLLRGTNWVFKSGRYIFVLKGLKTRYVFLARSMVQAIAAGISPLRPAFKPKPLHVGLCYCNRLFSSTPVLPRQYHFTNRSYQLINLPPTLHYLSNWRRLYMKHKQLNLNHECIYDVSRGTWQFIYRVSREECARLRENVP